MQKEERKIKTENLLSILLFTFTISLFQIDCREIKKAQKIFSQHTRDQINKNTK